MTPPSMAPRVRQDRARANDDVILDAALATLAEDGWEESSVLRVAERAGLSRRPILNRYGDRAGLICAVWTERLAPPLLQALGAVMASRPPIGASTDPAPLSAALGSFLEPPPALRAAAEVLIVASYQPDLARVVHDSMSMQLAAWMTPTRGGLSRADAARNAALTALALGTLIEARTYPDGLDADLTPAIAEMTRALAQDAVPRRLPQDRASFLLADAHLHPDPGMNAMLTATLRLVGRDGYEAATIDRIAAECGRTSGFIFGHYRNKRELYLDASARALAAAEQDSEDFMVGLAQRHSRGIAYAVLTREVMRPAMHPVRTNTLEQYRLAWHDADFLAAFTGAREQSLERSTERESLHTPQQAQAESFTDLARGIGYGVLAQLHPQVCELPHDVVTIPLIDG